MRMCSLGGPPPIVAVVLVDIDIGWAGDVAW